MPRFAEPQWTALQALIELLPVAAAQLRCASAAAARADYAEIAMAAQRALATPDGPTDLALGLDSRIRHLLVDEFQDTSVSQFSLLKS